MYYWLLCLDILMTGKEEKSTIDGLTQLREIHSCQVYDPHYSNVIMSTIASQTTSLTIVYSTVYSGADKKKHQSSTSLAFVRRIHWGSLNSLHKWPVTRKMFPFDDVIMIVSFLYLPQYSLDPFHIYTFIKQLQKVCCA